MKRIFPYKHIRPKDIEGMLYLIVAFAGKKEAKRFNSLSKERQQKVTAILQKRITRRGRYHNALDIDTVREVIDDARRDVFVEI